MEVIFAAVDQISTACINLHNLYAQICLRYLIGHDMSRQLKVWSRFLITITKLLR